MKWRAFELLGTWAAKATVLIITYSCSTISALGEEESRHRVSYESRDSDRQSIWIDEVGSGFRAGTFEAGMSLGGGMGHRILLSETEHNLALATFDFGWVFSEVMSKEHWYRGNWEV